MFKLLCDWRGRLKACLRDRTDLVLENLALRHQIMAASALAGCGGVIGWVGASWPVFGRDGERRSVVVQADTVLPWRRTPWWRHLRRQRHRGGRPRIDRELQALIRRMDSDN